MSTETIGTLTSEPDENGKHQLRCPKCLLYFRSQISEQEGVTIPIQCKSCNFEDEALAFLYAAQREKADKMVSNHVAAKLKKLSKNFVIKI